MTTSPVAPSAMVKRSAISASCRTMAGCEESRASSSSAGAALASSRKPSTFTAAAIALALGGLVLPMRSTNFSRRAR
ncbi:MAG: hypothetical protein M5U28_03860 [Sandaracinaceae bacterium]|nr:hypothetical protein [Sandaracinaceae bacterium]